MKPPKYIRNWPRANWPLAAGATRHCPACLKDVEAAGWYSSTPMMCKPCKREYQREYHAANRPRENERCRRYYLSNREQVLARRHERASLKGDATTMTAKDSDLLTDCLIATMLRDARQQANGEPASSDVGDHLADTLAAAIIRVVDYMSPAMTTESLVGHLLAALDRAVVRG